MHSETSVASNMPTELIARRLLTSITVSASALSLVRSEPLAYLSIVLFAIGIDYIAPKYALDQRLFAATSADLELFPKDIARSEPNFGESPGKPLWFCLGLAAAVTAAVCLATLANSVRALAWVGAFGLLANAASASIFGAWAAVPTTAPLRTYVRRLELMAIELSFLEALPRTVATYATLGARALVGVVAMVPFISIATRLQATNDLVLLGALVMFTGLFYQIGIVLIAQSLLGWMWARRPTTGPE